MRHWLVLALLCTTALAAQAGSLYRWVDENGKVQYSDKPPTGHSKDLTQLDKSGRVRNAGDNMTEAERAAEAERQRVQLEQRRKDRALLQSFSKPEEVDLLRDRQIEAVEAGKQTNRLRRQTLEERQARLQKQADRLKQNKKPVPNDLQTELDLNRNEIKAIDESLVRQDQEILQIKARAEADKLRLIQLRSISPN
ncbi:DUF4124 domain-containing protein [Chitinibacter bivalviorum]|uniref:DUF4124 domain-containing protein n=1 Tax=Chitinibacter bivalviorum TaxID=2739434 RepID=A0A7H9BKW8_9NEIS|nr:DUF4124 domain-containing protein [Chitinibacter bivalviorum]QLG89325.1 DUF4124 domain-containing protein [Chitinibacter bivalviorum]